LQFDKKIDLYRKGIVTFEQLLENSNKQNGVKLNDIARLQVETQVYNRPPTIDTEAIGAFLDTLSWPLYFLDFESYNEAVPPFDGMRPYRQTPFQYSLHIQQAPCGELLHREFLAEPGIDPRHILAERLCADIPKEVCVLVYNKRFEKMCIKELADFIGGDVAEYLMCMHENIKDLMLPFQSRAYYCRELGASYSIKEVLPALCPNDPELNYKQLDFVFSGMGAQAAYAKLAGIDADEQKRIKDALLAYCRLDTLAMVKVLEKLMKVANLQNFT
jgi:hypothetical protein